MVTNTLNAVSENPALHEIHRGTIRAHHAKAGYDYPTIRLPSTLPGLKGLPTRIYQTVHDGALAFLVVVSSAGKARENSAVLSENGKINAKSSALTWQLRIHCLFQRRSGLAS